MKFKILIISLSIILATVLTLFIVLGTITSKTEFIKAKPEKINIYKSDISISKTYTSEDSKYDKLVSEFSNMTKISILKQILNNKFISEYPVVNVDAEPWSEYYKLNGIYIEFVYKNLQNIVVYEDGNTRKISIKSIIFRLNNESNFSNVNIYYKSNDNFSSSSINNEQYSPLKLEAKTKTLYDQIIK